MSRFHRHLLALIVCMAPCVHALAQHRVDCILTLSPGLAAAPDASQTIQTGFFLNVNDPAPTPIRVFEATLGSVAPNFTDTPGFDCLPGTFPVPSSNGFTILKALRKWNGHGFDILNLPGDEHIQITYGPLGPVRSPDCDIPTPGFTVQVGSNGEWHRHLEYTLTDSARTGIYLLKLQIFSTLTTISPARPIWFVFQQANPPTDPADLQSQQDAAAAWVTMHLVPQLCDADFNADGHLTVQDIFDFLSAWFAGTLDADFNGDCALSVQDIFDFLNAWFAGCPG
jgi:hypothetical protein